MALFRLSSLVSVKLKYSWTKPNSSLLFFKRRVPDDVKSQLSASSRYAGKVHFVVSLKTSDPRIAAPKIAKLVKETDDDWEQLRNPTREAIRNQAYEFLVQGGVDPSDPEETPKARDAFLEFIEHQVPRSVAEDEDITEGRQIDRYLSPVQAAAFQMVQKRVKVTLGDCLDEYITARPDTDKEARMVFGYLFDYLETRSPIPGKNRELRAIQRPEVNGFVRWLLAGKHREDGKAVSTSTVVRYVTTLKAAFARAIIENDLGVPNRFLKIEIPEAGKDVIKRETFTVDQYRHLHHALDTWNAAKGPDQLRCILTLIAESGARLAEIVGLASADLHLHAAVPYLHLKEHPWRSLKTLGSTRKVALTPKALEAAKVALRLAGTSPFLFSQYTDASECRATSASQTLVQWVRTREGLKDTKLGVHSLRHGMEDLLRAVGCPDSARDQITGHKTPGMGANYGEGYPLGQLADWMTKAVALVHG
jgi:integrase